MKLPKFLRGSEEDQPEELDIPEEESKVVEAVSPEAETDELASELVDEVASESEVSELSAETITDVAEPEVEDKAQTDSQTEKELATLSKEAETAQESVPSIEGKPLEEIVEETPGLEETGLPASKPEVGELPLSEELPLPEPPKPSWPQRLLKWLFNKETRVGRTMRQLAMLAAVFGVGLLFAYFVWVLPQANRASMLETERQQTLSELTAAEDARASVAAELADSNVALSAVQDEVALLEARLHLSKASYQAAKAQLAIVEKQGADALTALDATKTEIEALNGYLAAEDPDVATEIEARLTAAKSALVRDADLAYTDLETLITLLMQQDKILTGK